MLDVSGLSFSYVSREQGDKARASSAPRKTVFDVTFAAAKGEVLGIVGPNGAGKSTLLHLLAGLLVPDEGEIRFQNSAVSKDISSYRRQIGFMSEDDLLYTELTVRANLDYLCGLYGMSKGEKVRRLDELAEQFELSSIIDLPIAHLSRGMRRRVSLVASLVHRPKVLLLDEPSSGLDVEHIARFRERIRSLQTDHVVVLTSHILRDVAELSSRILLLEQGAIVKELEVAENSQAQIEQIIEDYYAVPRQRTQSVGTEQ